MKTYHGLISELKHNQVFVFGSNTKGIHGGGAALIAAQKFGAVYGQAKGLQGNSYAIITKDLAVGMRSISPERIMEQILELYAFAGTNKDKEFLIAYSETGKNLNGYSPEEMAEMFACDTPPENIVFENGFAMLVLSFLEM